MGLMPSRFSARKQVAFHTLNHRVGFISHDELILTELDTIQPWWMEIQSGIMACYGS